MTYGVQCIVNCSGLGSVEIAGDGGMYPVRGLWYVKLLYFNQCTKPYITLGWPVENLQTWKSGNITTAKLKYTPKYGPWLAN